MAVLLTSCSVNYLTPSLSTVSLPVNCADSDSDLRNWNFYSEETLGGTTSQRFTRSSDIVAYTYGEHTSTTSNQLVLQNMFAYIADQPVTIRGEFNMSIGFSGGTLINDSTAFQIYTKIFKPDGTLVDTILSETVNVSNSNVVATNGRQTRFFTAMTLPASSCPLICYSRMQANKSVASPITLRTIYGEFFVTAGIDNSEIEVKDSNGTVVINNSNIDFGQVGTSLEKNLTFTIRNSGSSVLNLFGSQRVRIVGSPDFTVTTQPNATVAADGTTTFVVKLAPTGSIASPNATLSIINNDSDEGVFVLNLIGAAVPPPNIVVEQPLNTVIPDDGTKDFGSLTVGTAGPNVTFTVRNTGLGGLLLTNSPRVAISGHEDDFSVTATPGEFISAGGTTAFNVQFSPRQAGARAATMTIPNNVWGSKNPYVINLTGTGTGAVDMAVEQPTGTVIANGSTTNLGSTPYNTNFTKTFTIKNNGAVTMVLNGSPRVAVSGLDSDAFSVTVTPAASVAGLGSTFFNLQFNPKGMGVHTATLTIANNDLNDNPYIINVIATAT